jgi:tetratricopeptide (TPR) repeat protein
MSKFTCGLMVLLVTLPLGAMAASPIRTLSDDEVIEVLPTITRNRLTATETGRAAKDPHEAVAASRRAITVARQTGDNRYWGRAQAALAPWWDRPDAPVEIAVLQATVQQGRHEFEASRKVLTAALAREPGHAQGWLNLAALERLSGRYDESLAACREVSRAGQALYAQACELETRSLLGQHGESLRGLAQLLTQVSDADQQSWLLSLLAEARERAGQDAAALVSYEQSLARQPDLYTSIALSDLLLRTGSTAKALAVLTPLPQTDAVVLRRGIAWRRLGDPRWREAQLTFQERAAELKRRGDDPGLHGRELAMSALWLHDDAPGALALARKNLTLQREPVDWWLALQCAQAAGDRNAEAELSNQWAKTGLKDARLNPGQPASGRLVSKVTP